MLYSLHRGDVEKGFKTYLNYIKEGHPHDFALLGQAAHALIAKGMDSDSAENKLMCMFGAGVAVSSELLYILEKGIKSSDLKTQLIALSYLGSLQDDTATDILLEALSSPFLINRLEALLQLAKRDHPEVLNQILSLSYKVPDAVRAAFAQIAIYLEGTEADRYYHKLLTDPEPSVRLVAISCVAEQKRDDFLPCLHNLASGAASTEQEALALAFGELKDHEAIGLLKEWTQSKHETVRIAASLALFQLGQPSYLETIVEEAKKGSLFAIVSLGQLRQGAGTLHKLLENEDSSIRLNATLSLLRQQDTLALPSLEEFLVTRNDLGYWQITSPGGGLKAWRVIPSATQQTKKFPGLEEESQSLREAMLAACVEYHEKDLLKIAKLIFEYKRHALVPSIMDVLENKKSEAILQFLKEGVQKAGAPLIRNYCILTLFRMNETGPYEEQLIAWVKEWGGVELIRFKEEKKDPMNGPFQLNPDETSRFFVEACQALASSQNEAGIEALIHVIAYGNPKNRYALAGLLLRTIE
jgi:HEAT repeat protein